MQDTPRHPVRGLAQGGAEVRTRLPMDLLIVVCDWSEVAMSGTSAGWNFLGMLRAMRLARLSRLIKNQKRILEFMIRSEGCGGWGLPGTISVRRASPKSPTRLGLVKVSGVMIVPPHPEIGRSLADVGRSWGHRSAELGPKLANISATSADPRPAFAETRPKVGPNLPKVPPSLINIGPYSIDSGQISPNSVNPFAF